MLHPVTSLFVAVSMMALQSFRLSYTLLPSSTTILFKYPPHTKGLSPIEVTLEGMNTEVREHPRNALFPIDVTLDGRSMKVRLSQSKNALFPIDVTLDGISMEVRFLQPLYLLLVDYQYYTL